MDRLQQKTLICLLKLYMNAMTACNYCFLFVCNSADLIISTITYWVDPFMIFLKTIDEYYLFKLCFLQTFSNEGLIGTLKSILLSYRHLSRYSH